MNPYAVIAVLTGMIVALKYRVHVAVALLGGGLALLLISNPASALAVAEETLTNERTIFLMSMSLAVASFAELYSSTGFVKSLGEGLMRKLRNPLVSISLIPAVIGLMPVAGGALMSAPIVGGIGGLAGMSEDLMIFANVWFRHTIFLFYPISSLIVTVSAMTSYSVLQIAAIQTPVAVMMIAVGLVITWGGLKGGVVSSASGGEGVGLLKVSAPIIVGVTAAVIMKVLLGSLAMPVGVFMGYLTLLILAEPSLKEVLKSFLNWKVAGVAAAGYSIIFLQNAMQASGSSEALTTLISAASLPAILVEALLPGIFGFITGSTLTGIVVSLPIISSMIPLTLADVSIIYVSAYMMYIGSPAHLCLVYTAQYFRRPLASSYKYMIPAVVITLAASLAYLSLLR